MNSTIRCTDKFVYFYQDTPLSNWWTSEPYIPYDGQLFASSVKPVLAAVIVRLLGLVEPEP